MAGITVSFIIYSQWAPLTLMLTAAPGNGLLNSNTSSWLICLLSEGLAWPEGLLYCDMPLSGGHVPGAQWSDRHQKTIVGPCRENHCGQTPAFRGWGEDGLRTERKNALYRVDTAGTWMLSGGVIIVSLCVCFRPDRSRSAQSPGLTTEVQLELC